MKSQEGNGTLASTKCHRIHVWYRYNLSLFIYIWLFFWVNIGNYTIHGMDPMRTKGRNCKVSSSIGPQTVWLEAPWESNCRGKSFKLSRWWGHGNIWQSVSVVGPTITDCGSIIASLTIADTKHAKKNGYSFAMTLCINSGLFTIITWVFQRWTTRWWVSFRFFYVHPQILGEDGFPIWRSHIFSDGLVVQPATKTKIGPRKESPTESYQRLSTKCFLFNAAVTWAVDLTVGVVGVGLVDFWLVLMFFFWRAGKSYISYHFCHLMPVLFKDIVKYRKNIGWFPQLLVIRKHEPEKFWNHLMSGAARRCEDAGTNACPMGFVSIKFTESFFYPQDASFNDVILLAVSNL